MNIEIRYSIASFFQNDLPMNIMENTIYKFNVEFEKIFTQDDYLNLLEIDFKSKNARFILKDLLVKYIKNTFFNDQVIYLIAKYKLEKISLTEVLNKLDEIDDFFELPLNFSGYSSEVNRLGEEFYREGAITQIDTVLSIIDPNKNIYDFFYHQIKLNTPNTP